MASEFEDLANSSKTVVAVAGELMKAAGDNPDVRQAGKNLGKAALVVSQTINTCLLPLAAVNFGVQKARDYFNGRFQLEMAERAADIPRENVVEPKSSIAGPTLQALAFAHEEPDLREMYLQLLRTAMDSRVEKRAHPAFVEVIKQLTAGEACLLKSALTSKGVALIQLQSQVPGSIGREIVARHVAPLTGADGMPCINSEFPAMVDNWVRLGLVSVDYTSWFTDEGRYAWVEERPEVKEFRAKHNAEALQLHVEKGCMESTDFGALFAKATGLYYSSTASGSDCQLQVCA